MLNCRLILSDNSYKAFNRVFNPRNAMYISRNDGKFNNAVNHQKDTIINTCTFIDLGRKSYTQDELAMIKKIKDKSRI